MGKKRAQPKPPEAFPGRGKRLADLRDELGLTQTQVGKLCGCSQRNISKIERSDTHRIGGSVLLKLIETYNTTEEYAMHGEGPKHAAKPNQAEETTLLMLFRAISLERRGYILERLKDLYREEYGRPPPEDGPDIVPRPNPAH